MGFILDVILVLIITVSVYFSIAKGFVRSLIEVIGYVLSIIIAIALGSALANYIYDISIEPVATSAITTAIEEKNSGALDSTPTYIKSFLNMADIDFEEELNSNNANISHIISPFKSVAISAIKSVASVIIFIILTILVKLLARFVNSLFRGAILGTANKFFGGALGFVKGLLFASAFCMTVYFIASIATNGFLVFSADAIEGSLFTKGIINLLIRN